MMIRQPESACTTAVSDENQWAARPPRQARRLAHTAHRDASASRAAAHAPWWPGDINKNKRFERRPKSVPRTNAQPFLYRGDTAAPPPPPRGARHAPTPHTGQTVPNAPAPLSDGAACALLWSPIGRPQQPRVFGDRNGLHDSGSWGRLGGRSATAASQAAGPYGPPRC